jgi:large subunit ribosomal protein L18
MTSVGKNRQQARLRRHRRVRKKIQGDGARPRMCIYRSLKHIYAQLIDDDTQRCLLAVSSLSPEVRQGEEPSKGKMGVSAKVGKVFGEKAKAAGFETVAFDRGGYLYHGRDKALADGAREAGLKF